MDIPMPEKRWITPDEAKAMLKKNVSNRPLREATVREYATHLQNGTFRYTPDAIGFDTEGNLCNGQHRLTAVAQSGKGAFFLVVSDLERDAFSTFDVGRKRTLGDLISIDGQANAALVGSIARAVMEALYDRPPTTQEAFKFERERMDKAILAEAASWATAMRKHNRGSSAQAAGAAYYLIRRDSRFVDLMPAFFQPIPKGEGLSELQAGLRNFLACWRPQKGVHAGWSSNALRVFKIVYTWNAFVRSVATGKAKFLHFIPQELPKIV